MSVTVVLNPNTQSTTRLSHMADKEPSNDDPFSVVFDDCSKGLGIKIIGGLGEEEGDQDYAIFIRKVLPGGLAAEHGVLQEGDQLLSVNGESLENITNDGAVELLRDASAANYVKLQVTRDETAKEEYEDLLQAYSYSSASSVCDRTSLMSPMSQNNGWTSPLSHTSCESPTHTHSLRQRCEGSSSGSEHGSIGGGTSLSPHMTSSPITSLALKPTPKVPNSTAASIHTRRMMAPHMSSTPQGADSLGYHGKAGAPDGASGGTPDCPPYQPSPVLPTDASALYTLPGTSPDLPTASQSYTDTSRSYPGTSEPHDAASHSPSDDVSHGYHMIPDEMKVKDRGSSHGDNARARRLSIDPFVRLKVSKLEMALQYLGIDPKPEDFAKLRKALQVDSNGMVTYKEFVEVSRNIFKFQLEEKNFSTNSVIYALNDLKDFTDPPAFIPQNHHIQDESLKQENQDLRIEVKKLKKLLRDKEDELIRVRQEAHGAVHESQSLRTKVHLVEQAQRAARNMEQDYEEVVKLLEADNMELRRQNSQQVDNPAIQKRMAVLGCQLRKSEVTKKTYEVATDKLLKFVERVHDTFAAQTDSHSRPESAASQTSQPPGYQHKKPALRGVANEAKDVAKAVRSLLEVESLPFGWEESYTADGMKYYMNHVTQVTSWQHPLSNIQHTTPAHKMLTANNTSKGTKALRSTAKRKQLPSIPPSDKVNPRQTEETDT